MKQTRDVLTITNEMVEALIQAEGAASHLIQHYRNPKLFIIRDALGAMKDLCIQLSPHNQFLKPVKKDKKGKIVV